MADIFTPEKRSWVMSRIRSKDTKIEKKTASLLRKNKIRYRRFPKVFGSPDFVVEKKVIVFCDGDFWHGYQYDKKKKPPKVVGMLVGCSYLKSLPRWILWGGACSPGVLADPIHA